MIEQLFVVMFGRGLMFSNGLVYGDDDVEISKTMVSSTCGMFTGCAGGGVRTRGRVACAGGKARRPRTGRAERRTRTVPQTGQYQSHAADGDMSPAARIFLFFILVLVSCV